MKGTHCDGKGGWTRVAYLNMTESGATCPPGLTLQQYNNIDHGLCGRPFSFPSASCSSTTFSTLGLNYYKVCGQLRGYQYWTTSALYPLSVGIGIDSYYVDGISITYGQNPRKHIWTYAAGLREDSVGVSACPCNTGYYGGINVVSFFVGNHYYCEAGLDHDKTLEQVLYANDTLWDGKNCDSREASCCTNSKMPWFYRVLDDITQEDIELRVCSDQGVSNDEEVPLDIIELYVR